MPRINWSEMYAINNQVINSQHKKLFSILNRLQHDVTGKDDERSYIIAVERLWSYANYHFLEEERLMAEVGFTEIYRHTQEHRLFTQKLTHLKELLELDQTERSKELIEFLSNWILQHIMIEDKKILP